MKEEYISVPYRIPCYMYDRNERLRPTAFMDIAQELAGLGAEKMHFSDRDLLENDRNKDRKLVWILSRMTVSYDRLPQRYDADAILQTWHRGASGPYYFRDYLMLDQDGKSMIRSSSTWIIMDACTRKVIRPGEIQELVSVLPEREVKVLESDCPKLAVPKTAKLISSKEHTVVYSDLDYNGHVNNAKYSVWAMDCIPVDVVCNCTVKRISINFNHEALANQTVSLETYINVDDYFVVGEADGAQVFVCKIEFSR